MSESKGPEREWWVYSTALADVCLMVECRKTGAKGIVRDPTRKEWAKAFHAPNNPYRWFENDRVEITKE